MTINANNGAFPLGPALAMPGGGTVAPGVAPGPLGLPAPALIVEQPAPPRTDVHVNTNGAPSEMNIHIHCHCHHENPPTGGGPGGVDVDDNHEKWHIIGDPHYGSGAERWDNMMAGEFIAMRSQDGSFMLQNRQENPPGQANVTVNTAAAVKDGNNVVSYDAKTKQLLVNGQQWDGNSEVPGGTRIERLNDGYRVTSSQGDIVNIHHKNANGVDYLDLDGEIGPNRKVGEVKGALGQFDNVDDASSHLRRDGTRAQSTDAMQADWTVKPEENLFRQSGAQGGGPVGGDQDITKALAAIVEQLNHLLKALTELMAKMNLGGATPVQAGGPVQQPGQPTANGTTKAQETQRDGNAVTMGSVKDNASNVPVIAMGDVNKTEAERKADEAKKAQQANGTQGTQGTQGTPQAGGPQQADDPIKAIIATLNQMLATLDQLIKQLGVAPKQGAQPATAQDPQRTNETANLKVV